MKVITVTVAEPTAQILQWLWLVEDDTVMPFTVEGNAWSNY